MSLHISFQVFHTECLKSHLIRKEKGGVCVNCHEKGAGKARVVKNEAMGVKSARAGRVAKAISIGDSVSQRHFRDDVTDSNGSSSGRKGFGMSLLICPEEVCCMFKVCFWFPWIFGQGVPFPMHEVRSVPCEAPVHDYCLYFIFFLSSGQVRRWLHVVGAVHIIFAIGR